MTRKRGRWTHPSVLQLAGERDPVEAVSEHARAVVLKAFDDGWHGPPFDPFRLADLLQIDAVPKHDVGDARTVPVGRKGFQIEFNPSRPRGRLRYSIAHEIAHTLFPDCAEQVRHRLSREEMADDEWQLEALCNVAAAEFLMPVGSFPGLRDENDLGIGHLLDLRRQFDVSTEALLIRAARLASHPCAAFAASRIDYGPSQGRYRAEYAIQSPGWGEPFNAGTLLPATSAAAECTAIGFTATGSERWSGWKHTHKVECVGLPPYPGSRHPRVAGIAFASEHDANALGLQFLVGDATEPRHRPAVVVQVVNDATPNWGGRGFARAIRRKWPDVQDAFRGWVESERLQLGTVHFTRPEPGIWVGSLIAQKGYGPSRKPRIRYTALREALRAAADFAGEIEASVHMPRIGCGEGGGDWVLVEELVRNEVVRRGVPVTVYDLPGTNPPVAEQRSLDLAAT